ncbi:hypothetical protein CsSME_00039164 [Camellia sinensis var. sinensis]
MYTKSARQGVLSWLDAYPLFWKSAAGNTNLMVGIQPSFN